MQRLARRMGIGLLVLTLVVGVGLAWLRARLPDTFYIAEGEPFCLLQTSWLAPRHEKGASQTSAGNVGSSYNVQLALWGALPIKEVRAVVEQRRTVLVSGRPFGIKLFTEGALVVGFSDVLTDKGYQNPAKEAGLKLGDRLLSMDGTAVNTNEDVSQALSGGGAVRVIYSREEEEHTVTLTPVQERESRQYRVGMWVRDSSAGIGTLTFVEEGQGIYAGLGHSISDTDTGEQMAVRSGEIVAVSITSYAPGSPGEPGELKGSFLGRAAAGDILMNGISGVYGHVRTRLDGQQMEVAMPQEVHTGAAQMLTTIEGEEPQLYDVNIEKVSLDEQDPNRNLMVRVTDERLLRSVGGIVQGMSGSPIVQDGRLVGAVTHVLVNDPSRGFGIFAHTMLASADAVAQNNTASQDVA